jgi:hypothetical protein
MTPSTAYVGSRLRADKAVLPRKSSRRLDDHGNNPPKLLNG